MISLPIRRANAAAKRQLRARIVSTSSSDMPAPRDVRTRASGGPPSSGIAKPRRVLLTNDDGPESPFFARFAQEMRTKLNWSTYVCIPDSNWSYVSKSLKPPETSFPVDLSKGEEEARVPVSPASCVNLALYDLARDVDLVVSGPNVGHNLGRAAILSSGTVGAALEGCIHNRKAIAVSFPFKGWNSWTDTDIESAVDVALEVTEFLWTNWNADEKPGSTLYNVNVPLWCCAEDKDKRMEWRETEIDQSVGYESLFRPVDGKEKEFEWFPTGQRVFDSEEAKDGGDIAAVRDGHVSITKMAPTFELYAKGT